jgi:hypothetical protein
LRGDPGRSRGDGRSVPVFVDRITFVLTLRLDQVQSAIRIRLDLLQYLVEKQPQLQIDKPVPD